jgi:hypothetical protein
VQPGRKITDGIWAVNLCRNWKPDWAWSSLSGAYPFSGLRFIFTDRPAPAVQVHTEGHPAFPPARHVLTVYNPSPTQLPLKASLSMVRNNMPELRAERDLVLAPGQTDQLDLPIAENDPTSVFELSARVTGPAGSPVYYERTTRWRRASERPRWATAKPKEVLPLDFQFAYYPSRNVMRIKADINGLPRQAVPTAVTATIRDHWTRQAVKTVDFPLAGFRNGRQELRFELPPLEGDYDIELKADGQGVPAEPAVKRFERRVFPWENLPTGRSTQVYPPFTPIRLAGRTLSTVLRDHVLNDQGLLDQVACTSANTGITKTLLSAPMRYVARVAGAEAPVQAEPLKVLSAADHQVITTGAFRAGALHAAFRDTWDYDGCLRVDLTLEPTGGQAVDELTLEIPFDAQAAPLIHANSDRIRAPIAQKLPAGEGVVWDGSKVACDDFLRNFCPYIYLGSPVRGLCWFADNDRNWGWDPATPNMTVLRRKDQVILRVHLINRPTVIEAPRTITFGLLAAPVKPMLNPDPHNPHWWRYRFARDKYRLLGTDINWFGNHSCGTVYPVGCDLYLWEMLARGNRQKLSDAQIRAVAEYGRRYFADRGDEAIKTWDAHVNYNLRNHLGGKMIFYYNRAACQELPEFETFKDEWCLTDYRAIGKGRGRGEIKIVPSESYINFCLYWYARSFEIGNNQGVYWDNYFIVPSFNTEMTAAYQAPDGSIVPSAGIWALRDLCRRTFVMMSERGMLPITFPHMTSFNPLPMMSFATVQYDWEWKYSAGDVQDRHSREYIVLATTGELAGVWPVPLADQGPQSDDPWVQRTFSAVRIVHELDGYGGWGASWIKAHRDNWDRLAAPIYAILDRPGLVVYKYWEDRPLPADTRDPDLPAIVYSVPGQEALVAVVSYAREDRQVTLHLDLPTLGFTAGCKAVNVETSEALPVHDGEVSFVLPRHDIRLLRLTGDH